MTTLGYLSRCEPPVNLDPLTYLMRGDAKAYLAAADEGAPLLQRSRLLAGYVRAASSSAEYPKLNIATCSIM